MAESRRLADWWNASGSTVLRRHHPADLLVILLLVEGFFLGPLKLLGASWFSYLSADGLALLILLVVFGERVARRKPLFAASPLSVPLLLLAAYCVLELANPDAPFLRSVLGLRSWLLYLCFYFVGLYTLRSVHQLQRLYSLLLGLGVLTAVYGVYQWRVGPQSFAGWSEYYGQYARFMWVAQSGAVFRAFSTFVTPGAFGGNMALLMLLAFSVAASTRISARVRMIAAATFAVMGVGIAASGSRGPVVHLLLAALIGLPFVPGVWRRVRVGFLGVAMAGVAVVVIGFVMGPMISERFSSIFDPGALFWKWFLPLTNGVRIAQEHPFGMGLGYTAGVPQFIADPVFAELPTTNVDSGYGSAAAELGFLGLAVFIYFALKVGMEGFRTWKRLPSSRLRDLLLGPALYAATYPIVSVIFQPQAALPSAIYFWLLIGMVMKAPTLTNAPDADKLLRSQMHPGQ
jgi:O-antigen ligase/polysaccharide polymerase Wzy-like membrane protein